ncbi:hypothetical protein GCM10027296_34750 [Chitinimonas naiadis]
MLQPLAAEPGFDIGLGSQHLALQIEQRASEGSGKVGDVHGMEPVWVGNPGF